MRGAGISNKDIKGVFKESGTDLAQGKKAATTLARAADMNADTISKQEALADLDDDIETTDQTGGKVKAIMMDRWVLNLMVKCLEMSLQKLIMEL